MDAYRFHWQAAAVSGWKQTNWGFRCCCGTFLHWPLSATNLTVCGCYGCGYLDVSCNGTMLHLVSIRAHLEVPRLTDGFNNNLTAFSVIINPFAIERSLGSLLSKFTWLHSFHSALLSPTDYDPLHDVIASHCWCSCSGFQLTLTIKQNPYKIPGISRGELLKSQKKVPSWGHF